MSHQESFQVSPHAERKNVGSFANNSTGGETSSRLTELFGLEGTIKGHPVQPCCEEQGQLHLDQAFLGSTQSQQMDRRVPKTPLAQGSAHLLFPEAPQMYFEPESFQ